MSDKSLPKFRMPLFIVVCNWYRSTKAMLKYLDIKVYGLCCDSYELQELYLDTYRNTGQYSNIWILEYWYS